MKLRELWNRDVRGALVAALLVGGTIALVVTLLAGCSGYKVYAEYEHHSSAPDYYDRNTSDQVGVIASIQLGRGCLPYCPEMEIGLHKELDDRKVFGRDPVGTIRIRQPLVIR